jgi:2-phosphosulfolactate phosphatase
VESAFAQSAYQVRFDWDAAGAAAIRDGVDVVVVVDVLSFGTAVDCALAAGVEVFPYSGDDAAGYAASHDAVLAPQLHDRDRPSLSPASFTAAHSGTRVVLPSPNGSRLCFDLAGGRAQVVVASFRNRRAVAEWVLGRQAAKGGRFRVAVVAAGERWPDGSPRFGVEDLLGAGAVIESLIDVGLDHCSPEAAAAGSAFAGMKQAVRHLLKASGSGRELVEAGYADDVMLATELDVSSQVPVLREWSFRP